MSKPCSSCLHHHVLKAKGEEQTVCLHPAVAEPSVVHPQRTIGLDAGTCRSSAARCGPDARWWVALVKETTHD